VADSKTTVQSTEVIRETKDVRVTVLRLSEEAKRNLSTDGAYIRADSADTKSAK
jgi:hypothetical protein